MGKSHGGGTASEVGGCTDRAKKIGGHWPLASRRHGPLGKGFGGSNREKGWSVVSHDEWFMQQREFHGAKILCLILILV